MKTNTPKQLLAVFLSFIVCLSFSACSFMEDTTTEDESEVAVETTDATQGGSVILPEGFMMPEESNTIVSQLTESNMLIGAFNKTNYRTTTYFSTDGSITVNVKATLETGGIDTKWTDCSFSLWEQGEGTTQYMGSVHFLPDNTSYTYTFSGLNPATQYRVGFSYTDVPKYKLSGTFNISGVTAETEEEMTTAEA